MDDGTTLLICPHCQKRLRLKGAAGKRVRCPNPSCGQTIDVPEEDEVLVGEVEDDVVVVDEAEPDDRPRKRKRPPELMPTRSRLPPGYADCSDLPEERLRRQSEKNAAKERDENLLMHTAFVVVALGAAMAFAVYEVWVA